MIDWNRHYGLILVREFVAALGFLAVLLLAFAHQPVEANSSIGWQTSSFDLAESYCGDGPDGDGVRHGPCHACRVAGTDLPPPPCVATSAYGGFDKLAYAHYRGQVPVHRISDRHTPRAPPHTA